MAEQLAAVRGSRLYHRVYQVGVDLLELTTPLHDKPVVIEDRHSGGAPEDPVAQALALAAGTEGGKQPASASALASASASISTLASPSGLPLASSVLDSGQAEDASGAGLFMDLGLAHEGESDTDGGQKQGQGLAAAGALQSEEEFLSRLERDVEACGMKFVDPFSFKPADLHDALVVTCSTGVHMHACAGEGAPPMGVLRVFARRRVPAP